eukprot:GILK01009715.1.p1 GENE.GILK01009715.1~~GILK01009715.1.p1  ORF type:complete len:217 (+),score=31.78 GILK01009715.1:42-692(+)
MAEPLRGAELVQHLIVLNKGAFVRETNADFSTPSAPSVDPNVGKDVRNFYLELLGEAGDTQDVSLASQSKSSEHPVHYCPTCDESFGNMTMEEHYTSMTHNFRLAQAPHMISYGISSTNKGFKMLQKHGWSRDEGLGAHQQGILEPLQPHEKHDRLGVGIPVPKEKKKKARKPSTTATPLVTKTEARRKRKMERKHREKKHKAIAEYIYRSMAAVE